MRAWNRRLFFTVVLLAAAEALRWIPLPWASWWSPGPMAPGGDGAGPPNRLASLAAAGIAPYLLASLIVVIARAVRRRSLPFVAADYERSTRRLALILAALFGLGLARVWHVFFVGGAEIAVTIVHAVVVALSVVAGTAGFIAIAHAITRLGIGNGACLLVLVDLLRALAASLWPPAVEGVSPLEARLPGIVATAIALALSVPFLKTRVDLSPAADPAPPSDEPPPEGAPVLGLRGSGIGVAAVRIAAVLLSILALLGPGGWLAGDARTVGSAIVLVVLSVPLTFLFLSWSFDPARLAALAERAGLPADPEHFRRAVARHIQPGMLLLAVAVAGWSLVSARMPSPLPEPTSLLMLAAIALSLFERRELHGRLARAFESPGDDSACARCGAPTAADADFCRRCGCAFREEGRCGAHDDRQAVARCVICHVAMCAECAVRGDGVHRCERHGGIGVLDGWAVVARPDTHAEAQVLRHRLATGGVDAEILATTISPLFGSLGIFDVAPAIPMLACSTCAGGETIVLVVAPEAGRAMSLLEERPPAASAG